jgi:hypothetical protein
MTGNLLIQKEKEVFGILNFGIEGKCVTPILGKFPAGNFTETRHSGCGRSWLLERYSANYEGIEGSK